MDWTREGLGSSRYNIVNRELTSAAIYFDGFKEAHILAVRPKLVGISIVPMVGHVVDPAGLLRIRQAGQRMGFTRVGSDPGLVRNAGTCDAWLPCRKSEHVMLDLC